MAKTWTDDNPKAALMARKRAALVAAAETAFLERGYGGASVNDIAAAAGVSIKTLYRHFDDKDDLFSAVMQAACGRTERDKAPAWYALPPGEALPQAGKEYLRHLLSPDQLALYRVVVRDAHRFPELGRRYHEVTAGGRDAVFAAYLDLWCGREGWAVRDKHGAAQVFAALLKARLFDEAVLGLKPPSEARIAAQARSAAAAMLLLLRAGSFA